MTIKQKLFVAVAAAVSLTACASPNAPDNTQGEKVMEGGHAVVMKREHELSSVTSDHHEEGVQRHGSAKGDHGTGSDNHGTAKGGHASGMDSHGKGMKEVGGHGHQAWVEPPHEYEQVRYAGWGDKASAERGAALFKQQCAACHGKDGTGNGPIAASLEHPPADLTNHFHMAPGEGDGYLFWRVSEGGQTEPFKSAKSAMPAFKATLSEPQRWDVLTYVHQTFHKGFKQQTHDGEAMPGMTGGMTHEMKDRH